MSTPAGRYQGILIVISEAPQVGKQRRTAILIRCTIEEAQQIREAAEHDRRTISGFILNAVMSRVAIQEKLQKQMAAAPRAQASKKATGA